MTQIDLFERAVLHALYTIPNPVPVDAIYHCPVRRPDGYTGEREVAMGNNPEPRRAIKSLEKAGLIVSEPHGRGLAWSLTATGRVHADRLGVS